MVDKDCKYFSNNSFKISNKIVYGCNVTHGICDSDNHSDCEKYRIGERLRKSNEKKGLEDRTDG